MELPYKELVYILETVLKLDRHYFIIVSVMFYALLSYGGLLALFVSHYLLSICQDFVLLLFNIFYFVVISCGPVLNTFVSSRFYFRSEIGICYFRWYCPLLLPLSTMFRCRAGFGCIEFLIFICPATVL
jgi:hypothetical protein